MTDPVENAIKQLCRRRFFGQSGIALGTVAGNLLMRREVRGATSAPPQLAAKAKRVIFLFQSGGPSQLDLFDYKPRLAALHQTELPDSVRQGQRLTEFTSQQASKPIAASKYAFAQHGGSGAWVSSLLPRTATVVDDLCIIKSVHTDAINHDPAITMVQTGTEQSGRPALGAWLSYGLGSENDNLPSFVVLVSKGSGRPVGEPLYTRLWGSGFLPSVHQGIRFRSAGDPVLYLSDPAGIRRSTRRHLLNDIRKLNQIRLAEFGDPEINARIDQYELAYRMQASVPELTDVSDEPDEVFKLYGDDSRKPGTYAANCLLARRIAERGVRCIQLFHRGWDQHFFLPKQIEAQCRDIDQATAALIIDLKRRGLLEDTLVVWGGEFGRTVYCQGELTATNYGRDHHPRCFTMWMAGGGIRGGLTYGETDDYGYNVVQNPVAVHDLNATILRCLGIEHTQLTFKFQGRQHRLTDVHGNVLHDLFA